MGLSRVHRYDGFSSPEVNYEKYVDGVYDFCRYLDFGVEPSALVSLSAFTDGNSDCGMYFDYDVLVVAEFCLGSRLRDLNLEGKEFFWRVSSVERVLNFQFEEWFKEWSGGLFSNV